MLMNKNTIQYYIKYLFFFFKVTSIYNNNDHI